MKKIKNLFLYGGLEKEQYYAIRENIREANRSSLIVYALITGIGMLIMFVLSFFLPLLVSSRSSYLICIGIAVVMLAIAFGPAKKYSILTSVAMYLFTSLLLLFGILLGTQVEPNQASASFATLMFAVPLLFTDVPVILVSQLLISFVVYFIAANATQTSGMLAFNASVILPYGAVSVILCVVIMQMKISRLLLDHENKLLSEKDQLTGLPNRRCYEQKLDALRKANGVGALFCAFDLNGLKQVNDSLGHQAGDELLRGAADCILSVFGRYGSCYRIGGDEFFAIIEGACPTAEELEGELVQRAGAFRGTLVSGLSISMGTAVCRAGSEIDRAVQQADALMYREKEAYHRQFSGK